MSLLLQVTCRVNSDVLHSVYENLPPEIRGSEKQIEGVQCFRHDINQHMKNCADNVKLTLYINNVEIIICTGKMENEIVITIKDDGDTKKNWLKETWSKYFNDGRDKMKQISRRLLSSLGNYVTEHPLNTLGAIMISVSNFMPNQRLAGLMQGPAGFLLSLEMFVVRGLIYFNNSLMLKFFSFF